MQTALPVSYGRTSELMELHRRFVEDLEEDESLPRDPRQWTRNDVAQWISNLTARHNLPEVPTCRFMMNGKALCLMTPPMFIARVPVGGKLLYKDFQLRLRAAMYSEN